MSGIKIMKSFEDRLQEEAAGWLADGLITSEQRGRLLMRHPPHTAGGNRFMAILGGIGGALFVVGVSLVIKSNWQQLGDWVKIGGLVTLLTGSYALGWRFKMTPGKFPKTGDACLMVGAVCFMLGIALVSQIYHINSRPANGVLLWWIGIAAAPWLTRARGAQFVSIVAGLTWLTMETHTRDSWLQLRIGDERWFDDDYMLAAAGVLAGGALTLFGLGLRSGRREHFAGLHEKVGLIVASASLYVLGFTWSVDNWSPHAMHAARWQPVVVLVVLVAGAAGWAWRRNAAEVKALLWWGMFSLVPAAAHLAGIELRDAGWLWGGLACLALFLLNVGMIRVGLASGREGWINLGMAGIAVNIVTRYFLLFGSMLEGGVFFIVTGLVVLGLGYYLERKRRALVNVARKEVAS